ncbi:hypothetical protein ACFPTY_18645 [Halomonas beimenensis]|uniref:Uncharacterized protein n=1 Tax=Halomonas beimenensis TaxID=475662 RepID=A0A291P2X7_9GAMM|nr:hypothetical protein [Halomonas beimenensis]ATJ81237.1 hypothetical protein BEI_0250 [Halomonas beimenensis]
MGKRITPDQLDGIEPPGVSIVTRDDGTITVEGCATPDATRLNPVVTLMKES